MSSVSGWTSKRTTSRSAPGDLEILGEKVELRLKRDFLLTDVLKGKAQQVAQTRQRAVCGLDVAVHQRGDGVQRVEEEVRMELLLRRLELRLDQPRFELSGTERAILDSR